MAEVAEADTAAVGGGGGGGGGGRAAKGQRPGLTCQAGPLACQAGPRPLNVPIHAYSIRLICTCTDEAYFLFRIQLLT